MYKWDYGEIIKNLEDSFPHNEVIRHKRISQVDQGLQCAPLIGMSSSVSLSVLIP